MPSTRLQQMKNIIKQKRKKQIKYVNKKETMT